MELLKEVKKEKELQLLLIMRKYDEKERSFKEWRDREIAKQKRRVDFLKATNEALQVFYFITRNTYWERYFEMTIAWHRLYSTDIYKATFT